MCVIAKVLATFRFSHNIPDNHIEDVLGILVTTNIMRKTKEVLIHRNATAEIILS